MQILILGMHRSGTSAVVRLMNMLGCYLGTPQSILGANPENPKGFWENRDILSLDIDLLQGAGWRWNRVLHFDSAIYADAKWDVIRKKMHAEIIKLDTSRPWAIKDPRLCLLTPVWRSLLEMPIAVIVSRPPLEIAKSLYSRNKIPLTVGVALWEKYMLEALKGSEGMPRFIVHYHDVLRDPMGAVRDWYEKLTALGVRRLECPNEAEVTAFISKDLYRESADEAKQAEYLSARQLEIYRGLVDGSILEWSAYPALSNGAKELLGWYENLLDMAGEFTPQNGISQFIEVNAPKTLEDIRAFKEKTLKIEAQIVMVEKETKAQIVMVEKEAKAQVAAIEVRALDAEAKALCAESRAQSLMDMAGRVPVLEEQIRTLEEQLGRKTDEFERSKLRLERDLAAARENVRYLYSVVKRFAHNMETWNQNWWWRVGLVLRRIASLARLKTVRPRMVADIAAQVFQEVRAKFEPKPQPSNGGGGTAGLPELTSAIFLLDEWLAVLRGDLDALQRLWWFRLGYVVRKVAFKLGVRKVHPWDPVKECKRIAGEVAAWRKTGLNGAGGREAAANDVRRLMKWIETVHRAVERTGQHAWWKLGMRLMGLVGLDRRLRGPVLSADMVMGRYRDWRKGFSMDLAAARGGMPRLAVLAGSAAAGSVKSADIVVCVHNALEDVRLCLESVVRNTPQGIHRLYIVNDASDRETTMWLRRFASRHQAVLLESETAMRYTKAANRGMRASTADYVVLLNSDTIVPRNWLPELIACGESDPIIGVVGPLSNAASYQSVPEVREVDGQWAINVLPPAFSVEDMHHLVMRTSSREYPRVPFINGFCFAIKRAVIDKIGLLDEETFPKGYGEENDYCLRAADAGFQLAIADNVYVYHAKSRSYTHEIRKSLSGMSHEALKRKHGEQRMVEAVRMMDENAALMPLRARLRDILASGEQREHCRAPQPLRVLFLLLDQISGGGGSNSIVQEGVALGGLGVYTEIAVHDSRRERTLSLFPTQPRDLFYFYMYEAQLRAHAVNFDVVVATHFKTVPVMERVCEAVPSVVPAYYCQDYEPLFVPADRPDLLKMAEDSYTAHPQLTRFAKTDWIREMIVQHHRVAVEKVTPSLDTGLYHPRAHKPRILGKVHIVAMVRLAENRAPRETMELLRIIQQRYPQKVKVTIFGNSPDSAGFQALPMDFVFENRGLLIREEVADLMASADIFVDMSKFQGFGRTGLEAMAVGCAVLLPVRGGVHEYARHRENAVIVDTENMDECVAALDELVRDDDFRERLIQAGTLTAARFNTDSAAISELLVLRKAVAKNLVTVVVPIYNAFEEVCACIESLALYTTFPHRVLLIDDGSPDERIRPMLYAFADRHPEFSVICNSENMGYTRTINLGCTLATGDVVLLNSDTRVTPRWLEKLRDAAYGKPNIATVTPVSNAAGAFSVPERNVEKPLPDGISLERMAELVELYAPGLRPEVPTGNGFCMYITRNALQATGLFDAGSFPRGYGEENDFAMRARACGFVHVIEDSTFVYHKGTSSFKADKETITPEARRRMNELHPEYKPLINEWEQNDLLNPFREQLKNAVETVLQPKAGPIVRAYIHKPVLLSIMHNGKGGTLQLVHDLLSNMENRFSCYLLKADLDEWYYGRYENGNFRVLEKFHFATEWQFGKPFDPKRANIFESILKSCKPSFVHIHHLIGTHPDIIHMIKERTIPVIMSLHDFYSVSPTINLIDNKGQYTAGYYTDEEDEPGVCTTRWFRGDRPTVASERIWREELAPALAKCDAIVVPSVTTRDIVLDHHDFLPRNRFHVLEHGFNSMGMYSCGIPPTPGKPIKTVCFGALGTAKGIHFIEALAALNRDIGSPMELHILGVTAPVIDAAAVGCTDHGAYNREELCDRMAAIAPSLTLIPSLCPETFCYCLSESWAMGIPVLGSTLGAVGERITRLGGGWILPPENPQAWLDEIQRIAQSTDDYAQRLDEIGQMPKRTVDDMVQDYITLYENFVTIPGLVLAKEK